MLIVTATHAGDIQEAIRLYKWIAKLGKNEFDCLLVVDPETPSDLVMQLVSIAQEGFNNVSTHVTKPCKDKWPKAANHMFFEAVDAVNSADGKPDFLWLEPDAVPTKVDWVKEIASEWYSNGSLFMGRIYKTENPGITVPKKAMGGVAVYSAAASRWFNKTEAAWDMENAHLMVERGIDTGLIRHFWGQPNLPPTFVLQITPDSPINAKTLDFIPNDCVLFHRNKDGTLIDLLDRKLFPAPRKKIKVVFNVHAGDVDLAIEHARWLDKMGGKSEHVAIVAHDLRCPMSKVTLLSQLLQRRFSKVEFIVCPVPQFPYPGSANFAWQWVAGEMSKQDHPWFWMEADAIALKPHWVEILQEEYDECGRSFMGSVIPHMGHMNGGAVYPADAPSRMPESMKAWNHAWDMVSKAEISHDTHNSRNMFHLWTLSNRMPYPVGGGELPINVTPDEFARWNIGDACYIHRIKDNSVLRILMARK